MDYKKDFPIFQNITNHYLDTAATSQKPKIVLDKIMEYYEKYNGNPGRGSRFPCLVNGSCRPAFRCKGKSKKLY